VEHTLERLVLEYTTVSDDLSIQKWQNSVYG
jgi:hypothetical protein